MKAVHVKIARVVAQAANWPVGMPFVFQSSLWRIDGLYLATSRSGEREVWWIVTPRPNDAGGWHGGTGERTRS